MIFAPFIWAILEGMTIPMVVLGIPNHMMAAESGAPTTTDTGREASPSVSAHRTLSRIS